MPTPAVFSFNAAQPYQRVFGRMSYVQIANRMLSNDHSITKCFLCGNQEDHARFDILTTNYEIDCPVCGVYVLTEWARSDLDADKTHLKRQVLAWNIRDRREKAKPIQSQEVNELVVDGLAREPTPAGKGRLLLLELQRRSKAYGSVVPLDIDKDWPLIKARGSTESRAIANALQKKGLLTYVRDAEQGGLSLTWDAWEVLQPLRGNAARTAFVAMAFRDDLNAAFDLGIKPAIERSGLTPVRTDKTMFSEKICERILTEIHAAQFVIVDFTYQSGGVYFEAGYALALGKPLIWSCRKDDMAKVHFDTRQYPYIVWETEDDLAVALEQRLRYLKAISEPRD